MSEEITPTKRRRGVLVAVVVAVAILTAAGVTLYAISTNRERAESASGEADVVCVQVLKLRNAELKNVALFQSAVVDGWARRDPGEAATQEEKDIANEFFRKQRATLHAVNCP